MASVPLTSAYERFVEQVAQHLTPEEILAFKLSEEEQEHLDDLLDRNNEGDGLTLEERNELQQLIELEKMMSLLKAKALYALSQR